MCEQRRCAGRGVAECQVSGRGFTPEGNLDNYCVLLRVGVLFPVFLKSTFLNLILHTRAHYCWLFSAARALSSALTLLHFTFLILVRARSLSGSFALHFFFHLIATHTCALISHILLSCLCFSHVPHSQPLHHRLY